MGKSTLILGIIGGTVALIFTLVGLWEDWHDVLYMGRFGKEAIPFLLLICLLLICIVGIPLSKKKPLFAAILMLSIPLISFSVNLMMISDWGGLYVSFGLVLGMCFLIPSAILTIFSYKRRKSSMPNR